MPNEFVIQHRHVIWNEVYKHEYLPWVDRYCTQPAYNDVQSWKRVADDALRAFSIKEFGSDANGNPIHEIKLKARANHSNFAECKVCAEGRRLELEAIKNKVPREERERIRRGRNMHRQEWRNERTAMGQTQKEVSETSYACWMLDDKLGGQWIHHPIPSGNREDKAIISNWRYRCTLQGVTLTGKRHLFSILPPNLKTGNNFGVTAFVAGVSLNCRLLSLLSANRPCC